MVSPLALRRVSAWALPRPFCHGFGKVGEEHREPEPQRDLQVEAEAGAVIDDVVDEQPGGEHAAHLDHKHHRVLHHDARIQLAH